ncbi:hypothetical protein KIW84_056296 [Lathyrus oleraceus]|uniref:Uncharacterized protein n=1 Tax=Pisum sativum TaxID=3888 RepID=A0A9D5AKW3_PEA|nr:hypothetical protein KIW84_056296 [Pisum sativum]
MLTTLCCSARSGTLILELLNPCSLGMLNAMDRMSILSNPLFMRDLFLRKDHPNWLKLLVSLKALFPSNTRGFQFLKETTLYNIIDFGISKAFRVLSHPPKAPKIIEVIWNPPPHSWIKCNLDGTTLGASGLTASRGIFRDHSSNLIGYFAKNMGSSFALTLSSVES